MGRSTAGVAGVLAGLALAVAPAGAPAAAGDLDPTFSTDGKVSLPSAGPFVARAVAVQADGRLLVAGSSCEPGPSGDGTCRTDGGSSFRLARLTPDGGLDPEFGLSGLVTTPIGTARSQAFDVLARADGTIVAGGVAVDRRGRDVLALARYTARGELDGAFGTGGIVLQPVGDGFAALTALAEGPGGSILATGQAGQRLLVARFTAAGALDGGFGDGGVVLGGGPYGYGLGLAVDTAGRPLAAGISGDSPDPASFRFGELRLQPGGAADDVFGPGGAAEQRLGETSSFATAAAATADGGWVAAGAATVPADGRQAMAVVRGNAGAGTAWTAMVTADQGAAANDVVALPDGRVLAVGQVAPVTGGFAFGVARLTAAGGLDATFDGDGLALVSWSAFPWARATAGALLPDGRVVTAGLGCTGGSGGVRCQDGTPTLLVARQLADPASGQPPPPPPPPPPADTTPPRLKLRGIPERLRRGALRRRGLTVRVRATEPVRGRVTLSGRRRGSGRALRLARWEGRRLRRSLDVRLRPRRAVLARVRDGGLRLEVRLRDAAGNARTVRAVVRLR